MQEALTNIAKHAQAGQVWVSLGAQGSAAEVTVRDDGIGFDTEGPCGRSLGLVGMRYRVEAEGGALRVSATPGQGTLIRMTLPQRSAAPAAAPAQMA